VVVLAVPRQMPWLLPKPKPPKLPMELPALLLLSSRYALLLVVATSAREGS